MSNLRWKFTTAPMMDWTDRARKAKHDQHLNGIVVSRAVPNAVPRRRQAAFD